METLIFPRPKLVSLKNNKARTSSQNKGRGTSRIFWSIPRLTKHDGTVLLCRIFVQLVVVRTAKVRLAMAVKLSLHFSLLFFLILRQLMRPLTPCAEPGQQNKGDTSPNYFGMDWITTLHQQNLGPLFSEYPKSINLRRLKIRQALTQSHNLPLTLSTGQEWTPYWPLYLRWRWYAACMQSAVSYIFPCDLQYASTSPLSELIAAFLFAHWPGDWSTFNTWSPLSLPSSPYCVI